MLILAQTACALTFVTYFMALHPEMAQRLRAEVLEHHGTERLPTYESLRNLKYSGYFFLQNVICLIIVQR